jgi:NADH dehydrogenase [ubiquinone] 1 alpha subcomplex assembly factor 5
MTGAITWTEDHASSISSADSQSLSSLLNRAGFALPTVDVDEVQIRYPSIFELVDDIRAMGESNAALHRRPFLHRDSLLAAAAIYKGASCPQLCPATLTAADAEMHGLDDGTIPASFSVIYAIGWKPAATTPKPLKRGSASQSLKDVLGSDAPTS